MTPGQSGYRLPEAVGRYGPREAFDSSRWEGGQWGVAHGYYDNDNLNSTKPGEVQFARRIDADAAYCASPR